VCISQEDAAKMAKQLYDACCLDNAEKAIKRVKDLLSKGADPNGYKDEVYMYQLYTCIRKCILV
jgi:hypothetical protein